MKRVYKYSIEIDGYTSINMPIGAEILSVGYQPHCGEDFIQIWALTETDPNINLEKRKFRVAGTGHDIDEPNLTYIGLVSIQNGRLVFHVFEIKQANKQEKKG